MNEQELDAYISKNYSSLGKKLTYKEIDDLFSTNHDGLFKSKNQTHGRFNDEKSLFHSGGGFQAGHSFFHSGGGFRDLKTHLSNLNPKAQERIKSDDNEDNKEDDETPSEVSSVSGKNLPFSKEDVEQFRQIIREREQEEAKDILQKARQTKQQSKGILEKVSLFRKRQNISEVGKPSESKYETSEREVKAEVKTPETPEKTRVELEIANEKPLELSKPPEKPLELSKPPEKPLELSKPPEKPLEPQKEFSEPQKESSKEEAKLQSVLKNVKSDSISDTMKQNILSNISRVSKVSDRELLYDVGKKMANQYGQEKSKGQSRTLIEFKSDGTIEAFTSLQKAKVSPKQMNLKLGQISTVNNRTIWAIPTKLYNRFKSAK